MKKLIITLIAGVVGGGYAVASGVSGIQSDAVSSAAVAAYESSADPVAETLRQKTRKAIAALKDKDFFSLAELVSPLGLRLSPAAYVAAESVVIPKDKVANFLNDRKKYNWGAEDGSGLPIIMTPAAYYGRYIYSKDFIAFEPVYNQRVGISTNIDGVQAMYPGALTAEFHYPGTAETGGYNWRSLRLVFLENNRELYLVAIVNDEWAN